MNAAAPVDPAVMRRIEAAEGEWRDIVDQIRDRGLTVQLSAAEQWAAGRVAALKTPVGLCIVLGCRVPSRGQMFCDPCRGQDGPNDPGAAFWDRFEEIHAAYQAGTIDKGEAVRRVGALKTGVEQ